MADSNEANTDPRHSANPAARTIAKLRNEILDEWAQRTRAEIQPAAELQEPILIDTLPAFLDNLAEALSHEHPRKYATESTNVAQEHGSERARLSRYSPDQLIREYQILRDVILEFLSSRNELAHRERDIIQRSIDDGVCEAMMAFFLVQSRIREQFVAGLTHDLRNPLGAARMAAEIIQTYAHDPVLDSSVLREDVARLASRVILNAKRADDMIQDLLDASAVQMGERISLRIEACDMLSIVRDVILDLERPQQTRIHVNGVAVTGHWDRRYLRRAIENLVSNAFKYGGTATPVSIRVALLHERVLVQVHNQGNAIPLEEQDQLFQAYRRSRAAKVSGKKGWGIGLALVRGVTEAHGGSIALDSSGEKGTTFTIDIPQDARSFQPEAESGPFSTEP